MSKYYKDKDSELIIKWTDLDSEDTFKGIVMVADGDYSVGDEDSGLYLPLFNPYTPTPQELAEWGETDTLTGDNTKDDTMDDKDINLRLECLKISLQVKATTSTQVIDVAEDFYEWITQKP